MSTEAHAAAAPHADVLLEARALVRHYPLRRGVLGRRVGEVSAVDGVDLTVRRGRTLGLVGESGSGKSTLARLLLRLEEPDGGRIALDGRDLLAMSERELRRSRRRMQLVFQDPYASLDPRMTVREVVGEGWSVHPGLVRREERPRRLSELLRQVGLEPSMADRYPHQFSGGERQRIAIARALALDPDLLVLDEPVSALDVSVQAQVVNLIADLQAQLGFAAVLIAHDLSLVQHVAHEVAVLYLGRIAEQGPVERVYEQPTHPYTQALLSAVPDPDPTAPRAGRIRATGPPPSAADPPSGCRFRTRCWKADARCAEEVPRLEPRGAGHLSACHHAEPALVR